MVNIQHVLQSSMIEGLITGAVAFLLGLAAYVCVLHRLNATTRECFDAFCCVSRIQSVRHRL